MKRYFINILWVILALPFYLTIIAACLYKRLLDIIFKSSAELTKKVDALDWVDDLDRKIYELKEKYL